MNVKKVKYPFIFRRIYTIAGEKKKVYFFLFAKDKRLVRVEPKQEQILFSVQEEEYGRD